MTTIEQLNQRFGIPGQVHFVKGPGGMPLVQVRNALASADIVLQGAHVTAWQPAGHDPVIWLSPQARFAPGKSIRGGIPICWPWFGNHESNPNFPAHGHARTVDWTVCSVEILHEGATRIAFEITDSEEARTLWPHPCKARYSVTVGLELTLELSTSNTGASPFLIGEALHTYFAIGDISETRILGLEGCEYLDKLDGFKSKTERGAIAISSEIDRVYINTTADNLIEDRKLGRRIRITKSGGASTIVWNPWVEKSIQMGDMGDTGYRNMVCVESGNAAACRVSVNPGETHTLRVCYSVEK